MSTILFAFFLYWTVGGKRKEGGGGAGEAGEKPWGRMGCLPPPPLCIWICEFQFPDKLLILD